MAQAPASGAGRWALRLFVGHLALAAVVLVLLLVSITDANAGYPALFFTGILIAVSVPVWIATTALAAASLARGEARRLAVAGVLVTSALLLVAFAPMVFRIGRSMLGNA